MQTTFKTNRNQFRLALFSVLLLLATSCKKDDNPNPGPQPVPVTKLQEFKDGEDFIRFQYNTDGSLKKATVKNDINTDGDVVDFTITYNEAKVITRVNSSSGEELVPVYENNVLTRADIFMAGERTGYTNYQFQNGYMRKATIYISDGNDFQPILEFQYDYNASGNVAQGIILIGTDVPGQMVRAGHVDLQYDNKNNPLFAHKDFLALLWQGPSKNNVLTETIFDSNLVLEDKNVYTYTYKANGFPEKADVVSGIPGQPGSTSTVGYIYQ